ncbi:MAG TPA: LacI family DNA-binding transcriptional regulator [Enterobacteriaceae bacterium]|nr:LacI family DNA-binding transcriptional regulator [Enterobacteriaceae bacterium]
MKAITLYDVARLAGVSYQTVSRVINEAEHVSSRTREKVLQAMAELNYVPNRGAQQLAGKRTLSLGLMTADLALHAPSQIASSVKSRASKAGFAVLISMVENNSEAACLLALQELLAQRVSGLLINVPLEDAQAERLAALAAPLPVLFLDVSPTAAVNSLAFDAEQGARLGVEHLLALGRRRIALLGGPESSVSARARFSGWLHHLARAGLTPSGAEQGDWSAASGFEKAHRLLADSEWPDAILVANDQMALGVLRACAAKGISVPTQLSVIGYDDTTDSAWFTPPLTTVRQAFKDAGQQSVEWLEARLKSDAEDLSRRQLAVTLVTRGSTARVDEAAAASETLARLQELATAALRLTGRE